MYTNIKIKKTLFVQRGSLLENYFSTSRKIEESSKGTLQAGGAGGHNKQARVKRRTTNPKGLQWYSHITMGGTLPKRVLVGRPGQRATEYQSQYKAKQSLKRFYGNISEKELRNLKNSYKSSLVCTLERKLDVVVFRLGFAKSLTEARQLIQTGKIFVNESKIQHPNFIVQNGDSIVSYSFDSILAKMFHLKSNLFKLPSHLFVCVFAAKGAPQRNVFPHARRGAKALQNATPIIKGLFIKDPLESEVVLPHGLEIQKFNSFVNHYIS